RERLPQRPGKSPSTPSFDSSSARQIEPGKPPWPSVFAKLSFYVLSNSVHLAVRQLDGFGSGPILRAILGQARPDRDGFSYAVLEIAPLRSAPFQSGKRNGCKSPRVYSAGQILHVHVKIVVRFVSIINGSLTGDVGALC